ncbi:MAG TPA: hypothetical protein PKN50_20435 [Spirochaetota bacterium]|nr:hypothetical protein [Spirochaetota bacterium]HPV43289.1 hypothetical protein [Spirochaetota bacterium]
MKHFRSIQILALLPAALALLVSVGCQRNLRLMSDRVTPAYIESQYKYATIYCWELDYGYLENYREITRRGIIESRIIPEAEKKKLLKKLEAFAYENNRFYCFQIKAWEPYLDEKIQFRFMARDGQNRNVLEDVFPAQIKTRYYFRYGGSYDTWDYLWLIKTAKPIVSKNFSKDERPVLLTVVFPGGMERVYYLLKK